CWPRAKCAAMDAGHVARDGEPKPGRAGVLIACMIDAIERAEHLFALVLREAWAIILDLYGERAVLPRRADLYVLRETRRVVDKIGDRSLEGVALDRYHKRRFGQVDDDVLVAVRLALNFVQDLADIRAHDLLAGIAL